MKVDGIVALSTPAMYRGNSERRGGKKESGVTKKALGSHTKNPRVHNGPVGEGDQEKTL